MFSDLQEMIDGGYVNKRKHPTLDLWILNYSAACQFERMWTPTTIACRGLVLDRNNNPVARSFSKFFNKDEHQGPLPDGDFIVTDKSDGSMILCFNYGGQWVVSTRGSFESDQAYMAQKILDTKYPGMTNRWDFNLSYVFELIHPQNRIVVDYGDMEDLVFLTAIDPRTGRDVSTDVPKILAQKLGILTPCAEVYSVKDLDKIKELGQDNQEGFVVRWLDTDFRLKVKLDDYCRLHKLLTGVSALRVWDVLQSGFSEHDFRVWLENVPDEFYKWIQNVKGDLQNQFNIVLTQAQQEFKMIPDGTRKEQALFIQTCQNPKILFQMLDRKDPSDVIWKMIRPVGGKAFRCGNDG